MVSLLRGLTALSCLVDTTGNLGAWLGAQPQCDKSCTQQLAAKAVSPEAMAREGTDGSKPWRMKNHRGGVELWPAIIDAASMPTAAGLSARTTSELISERALYPTFSG